MWQRQRGRGWNPPAPASLCGLCAGVSGCVRTVTVTLDDLLRCAKARWLGEVEATDADAAIEAAAKQFNMPATKLIAVRRGQRRASGSPEHLEHQLCQSTAQSSTILQPRQSRRSDLAAAATTGDGTAVRSGRPPIVRPRGPAQLPVLPAEAG